MESCFVSRDNCFSCAGLAGWLESSYYLVVCGLQPALTGELIAVFPCCTGFWLNMRVGTRIRQSSHSVLTL